MIRVVYSYLATVHWDRVEQPRSREPKLRDAGVRHWQPEPGRSSLGHEWEIGLGGLMGKRGGASRMPS